MGKKSGSWERREIRKVRKLGKRKTLKVQVFNRGCRSDRREKFYFNQKSRAALEKISPCGRNDKAPIGLPVFHASFMPVNLVRLCCFSLEGEAFFQQKRYFALKKISPIVEMTALSVFSNFRTSLTFRLPVSFPTKTFQTQRKRSCLQFVRFHQNQNRGLHFSRWILQILYGSSLLQPAPGWLHRSVYGNSPRHRLFPK